MGEDNSIQEDALENCRVGYETAINLWIYEGEVFWSKFNAFLVANSIIIGSLVLLITDNVSETLIFEGGIPIVGIGLCLFWLQTAKRSFDYYHYWIYSAREIEEKYLKPVNIASRGADFADGNDVKIILGGTEKKHRLSCLGRLKVASCSYVVIGLFLLLYCAFFLCTLWSKGYIQIP